MDDEGMETLSSEEQPPSEEPKQKGTATSTLMQISATSGLAVSMNVPKEDQEVECGALSKLTTHHETNNPGLEISSPTFDTQDVGNRLKSTKFISEDVQANESRLQCPSTIILLEEDIEVKLSEANPTTQATDYNSREQEDILTRLRNLPTNEGEAAEEEEKELENPKEIKFEDQNTSADHEATAEVGKEESERRNDSENESEEPPEKEITDNESMKQTAAVGSEPANLKSTKPSKTDDKSLANNKSKECERVDVNPDPGKDFSKIDEYLISDSQQEVEGTAIKTESTKQDTAMGHMSPDHVSRRDESIKVSDPEGSLTKQQMKVDSFSMKESRDLGESLKQDLVLEGKSTMEHVSPSCESNKQGKEFCELNPVKDENTGEPSKKLSTKSKSIEEDSPTEVQPSEKDQNLEDGSERSTQTLLTTAPYSEAQSSYSMAPSSYSMAQSSYSMAPSSYSEAQSSYSMAPSSYSMAPSSYSENKSSYSMASSSHSRALLSYSPPGLCNMGNSCYINAVMQCLAVCFQESNIFGEIEKRKAEVGGLAYWFFRVIHEIKNAGPNISLVDLKREMGRKSSKYASYGQQDAFEFLMFIFKNVEEELKSIGLNVMSETFSFEMTTVLIPSCRHEKRSSQKEYAIILSPSIQTHQDHGNDNLFRIFWNLARSAINKLLFFNRNEPEIKLEDLLDAFLKAEDSYEIFCPTCSFGKELSKGTMKFGFERTPEILIIYINRYNVSRNDKLEEDVKVKLNDFKVECSRGLATYSAIAYCEHSGTLQSGHYTAHVRISPRGPWYECNDSLVTQSRQQSDSIESRTVYMVFYKKDIP